ncbi:ABC transporter substrate-binding protein [Halapricum desulfuricans]|uniref:ABC transporter substrate-binding protein n=1 Tax=Halapricum desulfuricans TaxID=2841257 RepID=UPI001E4B512F|nr:ABC transporter substrate-binding protein [Halapricum desulfuricans]
MQRRRFLKSGSIVALTGTVAGCASPGDSGETSPTGTAAPYSVSMAPVGEVTFDTVPEEIAVYMSGYADMLVALGHGDAITAIGNAGRYHTDHYDELDGVEMNTAELTNLIDAGLTRETFLSIGADLHLMDPNWLTNVFGMDDSDIEFVTDRAGPFLGNTIFRRTDAWHDYEYYTLYEAFEKVAQVVQRQDRYDAIRSFHDDFVEQIEAGVSAEGPRAALVWGGGDQPTSFSPYYLSGDGTNKKPFRDLNVRDAIANSDVDALSTGSRSKIDYETLFDLDPEVLFVRGHEDKTRSEFEETVVSFMQDHETASRITAVENGDVFRGGPLYMGPLQHLFTTERFATALYPDAFEGELFDREELASIVTSGDA